MTTPKDIAKKQAEIVGQLQQFPIGRSNSGGRAGGMIEVVVTNPLPGQPRVVQAKCANDCPPGDVQLVKADDDGSYVALSPNAAVKTSETTTRQISKKNPTIPKKDEEVWPVTGAFLYSKIKPNMEDLTDNGLAAGNETSWDWNGFTAFSSSDPASVAYLFGQQFNTLGDYATASDALNNVLKPDRLIIPTGSGGGSSGAARDDAAGGSVDGVTVWFYIGEPNTLDTNLVDANSGEIFKVSGSSAYPDNVNTEQGPGFCMQMMSLGTTSLALYPIVSIGSEPLTQYLKSSFPDLGGRIGYWGNIFSWHGMQDYSTNRTSLFREYWSGIPGVPADDSPAQTPTSYPPDWDSQGPSPWTYENNDWYKYGWDNPNTRISALSGGAIVVVNSALTAGSGFSCGDTIPNDKWAWSLGVGASRGALEYLGFGAYGMFVCWSGHIDNIGLAQSFFEAFRVYWEIPGSVKKLRSCNPFGCELGGGGGGGGYPSPPPSAPGQRYLAKYWGRKAEIFLKVCRQNDPPLELKLPIEFAACVEKVDVIGGGSFGSGSNFNSQKSIPLSRNYWQMVGNEDPFALEMVHGTLSIDDTFAYIDIFYGGERIREDPLTKPVAIKLANSGFGPGGSFRERRMGTCNNEDIVGDYAVRVPALTRPNEPRVLKDCFGGCHSYKVKLPTDADKNLTIVAHQKYKRGEVISLTAASQDNEFNDKFLICDFRTDVRQILRNYFYITDPNPEFASFGGLPALVQTPLYRDDDMENFALSFYKNQADWTQLDWIYWQLQEGPRQFNPLNTVLPLGVEIANPSDGPTGVFFEFDKKFGRHGRAECIIPTASFGYNGTYTGGQPAQYRLQGNNSYSSYLPVVSFSEQLKGNGIKENGQIVKWYRVSASSFPIHGQLTRNG